MTGSVRPARPDDVPAILRLVHALADYEREPDAVEATEDDFARVLFGDAPTAWCHVAEIAHESGEREVVGIAVWYLTFSTWTGGNGIWLEDLFVLPEHRGSGLGRALLAALAQVCVERGYPRLEWWVLDWNEPSIGFYRALGAEGMDEWTTYRVTGEALTRLASRDDR